MPAEARQLSALVLKSVTRKTLEGVRHVRARVLALGVALCSDVKAPELDRLLMQVTNLQFSECHRAWRG